MPLIIENPPPRMSDADEAVFEAARLAVGDPPLAAEAILRDGVVPGVVTEYLAEGSDVFPEAQHRYRVYVPNSYDSARPARLMVFQDGLQYLGEQVRAATVLDNLIAAGDLPPTIGVFIEPGELIGSLGGRGEVHRSIEYDTPTDAYARLVIEEIIPLVTKLYRISDAPEDHAICGMSSGGMAAFSAAWFRPDYFGKAICHCGTFVNLRGGYIANTVRQTPKRPIRVFLQSGNRDMDRTVGNWAVATHDVAAALKLKRYDYRLEFGNGGHTLRHAGAIFPQTLRWIWREQARH